MSIPSRPVEYGFFSFTEITDPAEHAAYNAWHLYDHMPEQYQLDGIVWGQRWTRRSGTGAANAAMAPLDRVHYVTCYLMTEPIERTLDEFQALADVLRAAGRFHSARAAHVAGCFRVTGQFVAATTPISAGVVPFRPHRSAHVRLDACTDSAAYQAWAAREFVPALLAAEGAIGAWTFAASSAARHPSVQDLHATLTWTDGDAADLDRISNTLPFPGADATTRIAAPLVPATTDPQSWFQP